MYESIDLVYVLIIGFCLLDLGLSISYGSPQSKEPIFSFINSLTLAYFAYKRGSASQKPNFRKPRE